MLRIGPRLTVAMLLVSGLPLALAGYGAIRSVDEALRANAVERQGAIAEGAARVLADALRLELGRMAAGRGSSTVLEAGEPWLLQAVALDEGATAPSPSAKALLDHADLARARARGASLGAVYWTAEGPRAALAVVSPGARLHLFELDVERWLFEQLAPWSNPGRGLFVSDPEGRVLVDLSAPSSEHVGVDRASWLQQRGAEAAVHHHPDLGAVLHGHAAVRGLGWRVVVSEPTDLALVPAQLLAERLKVWSLGALLVGVLLGSVLARGLLRPLAALLEGARSLQRGARSHRVVGDERDDELGDLARAFNAMAEEIERWGKELEHRVSEQAHTLEQAQAQLLRAQKLAAVGQLGAGVAHEINNPLAAVLGLAEVLIARAPEGSKDRAQLEKLKAQAERIREVVARLIDLASRDEEGVAQRVVDPRAALETSLAVVEPRLRAQGIRVVRDYADALPPVVGDADRLTEAFGQLLSNAERSMAERGGTLTVSAHASAPGIIAVRIADTGEGIPEPLLERIFEPFFTTKRDWSSKGLGLPLVNKTVEEHHGHLTVDSRLGHGAAFTVTLPAIPPRSLP